MLFAASRRNVHGIGGKVLKEAIPRRARLWIFYPRLLQLNLLLVGALVADMTNGFDNSMMNALQLIDSWQDYFGHPEGARLGLITIGARMGQMASLVVVSPLMDRLGRRRPILIGSIIILIGVALQASAQNATMFIIGRVILGFGNNIQECSSLVLVSELAHPQHRPQTTALINSMGSIGGILAAWIAFGAHSMQPNEWSWRLPTLLQAMTSTFQIVMSFLIPESPRWLVAQGRALEARRILCKYHAEDDPNSDLVRFEMAEIEWTLELHKTKQTDWMAWFRTRANKHRFVIVLALGFMTQLCGNSVISYFLKLVLDSIGITNQTTQLLVNGGASINGLCWAIVWSILIDKIGRRKLFLSGFAGMFAALLILTVLTGINESQDFSHHGFSVGALIMVFMHGVFYKMIGPTQDAYFTEIPPYGLRAKTMVIKQFGDASANLFSGFVNPIGLEKIEWRYYIAWCCALVCWFVITYLFFPETKNLSLEEVDQLFEGNEVPEEALTAQKSREREEEYDARNQNLHRSVSLSPDGGGDQHA